MKCPVKIFFYVNNPQYKSNPHVYRYNYRWTNTNLIPKKVKRITKSEPDIKRTFTELLADAVDVTFKVLC